MSVPSKIMRFLWGIILIALGIAVIGTKGESATLAAFIISVGLLVDGIQGIVYYFTMARFMVEGWVVLVRALLRFVLAVCFLLLFDLSSTMSFTLISLVVWFIYSGVQDVLMALERKAEGFKKWWIQFIIGISAVPFTAFCLFTMGPNELIVLLFGSYMMIKGYYSIRRTIRRAAPLSIED